MMWSMRTPPACRSIALTMARNGSVALLDELVGPPRRLRPVLAQLVELVRRCARGDAERQHVLHRPGVGAVRVHPDGEVVHDAQRHAGADGRRLRRRQLVVELPLQPAVEIDGCRRAWRRTRRPPGRAGCCSVFGPAMPVAAVPLGQRTPGREVVEAAALALAERRVGQLATRRPLDPVDAFERARLAFHAASRSISSVRRACACSARRVLADTGRACARRRTRGSPRRAGTAG